ncbi:hypothetical protein MIND_00140000 [Mycena indigotica]|uniref:Uncharacterized protein n=1 Tax=Mycena indigotica TaxID=2126181 RepID=A0A8H6WGT0_9AGAR|nr:uncharacterized protein MIND_00140000 [Mycena indigotica]KAF7316216.1 hypothetical protein MIND_00140000 [Mycena indigotica]
MPTIWPITRQQPPNWPARLLSKMPWQSRSSSHAPPSDGTTNRQPSFPIANTGTQRAATHLARTASHAPRASIFWSRFGAALRYRLHGLRPYSEERNTAPSSAEPSSKTAARTNEQDAEIIKNTTHLRRLPQRQTTPSRQSSGLEQALSGGFNDGSGVPGGDPAVCNDVSWLSTTTLVKDNHNNTSLATTLSRPMLGLQSALFGNDDKPDQPKGRQQAC